MHFWSNYIQKLKYAEIYAKTRPKTNEKTPVQKKGFRNQSVFNLPKMTHGTDKMIRNSQSHSRILVWHADETQKWQIRPKYGQKEQLSRGCSENTKKVFRSPEPMKILGLEDSERGPEAITSKQ